MGLSWLENTRRLLAIAQTGIAFAKDPFDLERYQEVSRIALRLIGNLAKAPPEQISGLLLNDLGYATPKVDVRGVVFAEGRLLLVRELSDGGWALPGGWADVGETPSESITKEIQEEAGLDVSVTKLLAVYDRSKHGHSPHPNHVYKLFFRCEIKGGIPKRGVETSDVGFFNETELPALSVDRVTASQIQRMFEHLRAPDLPTDFD